MLGHTVERDWWLFTLLPHVRMWSGVRSQWNFSFPDFNLSWSCFSPAPFAHWLPFFSLCCPWDLLPLAVLPRFLHSFCTPPKWLYHPSSCYFWAISISYVIFWTVNDTAFNIWLNSIFSFIFQLLNSFFYCLSNMSILAFFLPNSFILSTI